MLNHRSLITFIISLITAQASFAFHTSVPGFDNQKIYSSIQDCNGAIWFNSDYGLHRFNGHSVETFPCNPVQGGMAYAGGHHLYLKDGGEVLDFNPFTRKENARYNIDGASLNNASCLLAEGDSLFVSFRNKIYLCQGGAVTLYSSVDKGSTVAALSRTAAGALLAGTSKGVCNVLPGKTVLILPTPSQTLAIADFHDTGKIIIGLQSGGIIIADPKTGQVTDRLSNNKGEPMIAVRSFTGSAAGDILAGAANGLYQIDSDNALTEIPVQGSYNSPVHSIMTDRDGNFWVSTHYKGLLYDNFPQGNSTSLIPFPKDIPIKHIASGNEGHIWAGADGHGLWILKDSGWYLVPGTEKIKYQGLFHFPDDETLYASDWLGKLYSYAADGTLHRTVTLPRGSSDDADNVIWTMARLESGEYILGTNDGAYLYRPESESTITRHIFHTERRITKIIPLNESMAYLTSKGVSIWSDSTSNEIIGADNCHIYDMVSDTNGMLWASTDKGIVHINADEGPVSLYSDATEILSGRTLHLIALGDSLLLGHSANEIKLINGRSGSISRFDLKSSVAADFQGCSGCIKLSDGSLCVMTGAGIIKIRQSEIFREVPFRPATIDRAAADEINLSGSRKAVLDHNHTNLSFDAATFNYSCVESGIYEYRMEGLENDWHRFNLTERIDYRRMHPGSYKFRVRSSNLPGQWCGEDSIAIRIKPAWFASLPAVILWCLIVITIIVYIIRSRFKHKLLEEKLRLQQEENERQASFFVNLSYKMRTPVNLIIGQIEQYFREFGARTRGIERLQEIYSKTKQLRGLISDYVDEETENFEKQPEEVKFLNALTGVVERHLFEKEINVKILCEELNMGKTKLSEVTRKVTGMSPGEFIEDVRLRHAAQMLLGGNYHVTEIADALGFSSVNYFGIRFKKKFGCSPSKYRGA